MNICIVYLGRRGAGKNFTEAVAKTIDTWEDFKLVCIAISGSSSIFESNLLDRQRLVQVISGNRIMEIGKLLFLAVHPRRLMEIMKMTQGIVIFPMVSPLDFILARKLKKLGFFVVRFVHDFEKHPGEMWPGRKTLNEMMRVSDQVVTLDAEVSKRIELKYGVSTISEELPLFLLDRSSPIDLPVLPSSYYLFIGRLRKYKGVENLISAYGDFSDLPPLVVAGSGELDCNIENPNIFINRWLTESEILNLISNAACVIFPYMEASQSGIIPIVRSLNIPIIITNVGGLERQVRDYKPKVVIKASDHQSLVHGLELSKRLHAFHHDNELKKQITQPWLRELRSKLIGMLS
jgi:glycosyltransferase involved in cell wall biosynthesis